MRRRQLLALGAACLGFPLRGLAQSAKAWRIGVLETISRSSNAANFDALARGLRELGYVEGRNLSFDYRSPDGRAADFPRLAVELAASKIDAIVTRGTPAALAAAKATSTIPIVMAAIGEPPAGGIVASLARPGGNVTGLSAFVTELTGKRMEVLREAVPKMTRVGALYNMGNPIFAAQWKETQLAAETLGIRTFLLDIRAAEHIEPAFATAMKERAEGLIVAIDALTQANRTLIARLAARNRLPAIYAAREFADAGGLISYGVSYPDLYYRAAGYIDKIFKGARPGNLPIEQPTKYELVINRKAANEIGVSIPPSLAARTDELID